MAKMYGPPQGTGDHHDAVSGGGGVDCCEVAELGRVAVVNWVAVVRQVSEDVIRVDVLPEDQHYCYRGREVTGCNFVMSN